MTKKIRILTIIQKSLISHMITLVKFYERLYSLNKIDENGFTVAENQKELYKNIKFEEEQIKKIWRNDHLHLIGLLWKLKHLSLSFDPRVVESEKLFFKEFS